MNKTAIALLSIVLLFLSTTLVFADSESILDASIKEIQNKLASGEITSEQLVEIYLERMAAYDKQGPALNAISALNPEALKRAMELDRERLKRGLRGPLHGIPLLVKDNYETSDMQTALGSSVFAAWIPPHDATIVKRLREAGAIILGKANMHEFAMGFATHGSLFGQTLNPYALDRIPGGSSGGTGAAIAANFATAGFGSDTCGSIRMPASFNGLVGLRSTVGLSSRHGIAPLAHSWDTGGPMTHNVSDLAIIYDAIAGYDENDPVTAASAGHIPKTYTAFLKTDGLRNQKLGILRNLWVVDPEDKEVAEIVSIAVEDMKKAGAEIVDVTIPGLMELMMDDIGGFYAILAELRSDFNNYLNNHPSAPVTSVTDIIKSDLLKDEELRSNFKTAGGVKPGSTHEYLSLQEKRERIRQVVLVAMAQAKVDALIYPTVRQKPVRIGEVQYGTNCHLSGNINFPAISVPAGFTKDGLPVGIEILARKWQEPLLIQLAYAYEQATQHRRLPPTTPALP
ncbi:MAG: amidase [Gammaproteobacteria bacterium]|nr:amidase [Gammaproteobacteria bacterium]